MKKITQVLTKLEVADLLKKIPTTKLEEIAKRTEVDWNVSRLRGEVMLDLLLFGMCRSNRLSTRVLEHLYNSSFFNCFSTKDDGHETRHSSIADRLTKIPSEYFQAIFEWAWEYFSTEISGNKKSKLLSPIHRFDSTMVSISSALVDWGMKVGRPPEQGFQKMQLKVTVGMKGLFPTSVKTFFEQNQLSEETALYEAIVAASPTKKDWVVFDRGLKSRASFKKLDLQDINFVTRGAENCQYKKLRSHQSTTQLKELDTEETKFIQDSIVYLYSNGKKTVKHEFRLVEIEAVETGKRIFFITNILNLNAGEIAKIYRQRWDIEVFFRFLKQELNIKHLLNHSQNGVQVQVYVALLLAILLTVYKTVNNIPGYKIAKLKFEEDLLIHIVKELNRFQNDS